MSPTNARVQRSGKKIIATAAAVAFLVCGLSNTGAAARAKPPACTLDRAVGTTIDREPFLRNVYGARWNVATNRIAYMQPAVAGYYRVFTMRPDGSDKRSLSETPGFPQKHQGALYWHPSGRFVFLVAQKREWSGRALFGIPDYEALPGFGRHDDLWVVSADGRQSWRLTNDPNAKNEGVLIPVLSPDGKRVAWSSRQADGTYAIEVADVVIAPEPRLRHVVSFKPGGTAYYEPGSFSSDGKSLTYASDQDTHSFWRSQIYRLDLASGKGTRLTVGNDYNEHPSVVKTPAGDWIVYMSTKGVDRFPGHLLLGTDWYAMKANGAGAKRLTTMNVNASGNRENTGAMQVAGTVAMSPSGTFMLGDVQDNLVKQTGLVRTVRFVCP